MIDREIELSELHALSQRIEPSLALLYGRRRVGKTNLLERVWSPEERFYFLMGDTTPAQNRLELLSEFSRWSGEAFFPEDYPTWRTLFRLSSPTSAISRSSSCWTSFSTSWSTTKAFRLS